MTRFIFAILLAFVTVLANAAPAWMPLADSEEQRLEVDVSRFDYSTVPSEPSELHIIGVFKMILKQDGSKPPVESIFWTNVKTCSEGRGKLVMILVPKTAPVARTWSKEGRTSFDLVGRSLCEFHAAVKEQVIKDRRKADRGRMI